jgi:FkbM family methyltransferase
MSKWLKIYKLGFFNIFKLIIAYIGDKFIKKELFKDQQALIHHFNFLVKFDLDHVSDNKNYYVVQSAKYGKAAIRKYPSSDPVVFQQIFPDGEYNLLADLVNEKLQPGVITMIDGGANIGLTSISLCRLLLPHFELHSVLVEPFTTNIEQAKINIDLQDIKTFSILQAGIHNKTGYLKIDYSFRNQLEWSIRVDESLTPTDLRSIELLDIMMTNNWSIIDILKLDIEGSEIYLFASKDYIKDILKHVRLLAIEIHEEFIEIAYVLNTLYELGFYLQKHGELYIGYNKNLIK